jgi:hypothetical protein
MPGHGDAVLEFGPVLRMKLRAEFDRAATRSAGGIAVNS